MEEREAQLLSTGALEGGITSVVMGWHRSCTGRGTTGRGHQEDALLRLYRGCHASAGVILAHIRAVLSLSDEMMVRG